jgi:hypothetical protein
MEIQEQVLQVELQVRQVHQEIVKHPAQAVLQVLQANQAQQAQQVLQELMVHQVLVE